ncbi:hypothetical protein [Leucobacter chromiireducens]|uniref:hypothetical protein n=1 Tax=Leucobacter chromiireducens TaxID=283877 RepID=UPI003F7FB1E5
MRFAEGIISVVRVNERNLGIVVRYRARAGNEEPARVFRWQKSGIASNPVGKPLVGFSVDECHDCPNPNDACVLGPASGFMLMLLREQLSWTVVRGHATDCRKLCASLARVIRGALKRRTVF